MDLDKWRMRQRKAISNKRTWSNLRSLTSIGLLRISILNYSIQTDRLSMFCFREWEVIYEASKAKLMKAARAEASTDLLLARDEIRNKSEEAAQDLSDFLKGLEAITGYGSSVSLLSA